VRLSEGIRDKAILATLLYHGMRRTKATKLYGRNSDAITLDEMERIAI
jgi:hypothetical protein